MSTATSIDDYSHGDARRYRRGCRCTDCTKAVTAENARNHYLRQTGRGRLTTSTRAASHIDRLRAAGVNDAKIMEDAQTCPDIFYRVLRGRPIRRSTENRILAVKPGADRDIAKNGHRVPAVGTTRRLRTLAANGWPAAELGRRTGRHKQFIVSLQQYEDGAQVRQWVCTYVSELYDLLAGLRPEDHGVPPHIAALTRKRAAGKGWLDSGYWDVEDFDDPDFAPAAASPGQRDLAALRREEIIHLAWHGENPEQILNRLDGEMSISTVRQIVHEWRTGQKRVRKQVAA